jgi:succinate dehydrogenase / fumarate reductase cytochrome b subunit
MYRGQSGMWSWLIHRVTGVAILLFLLVHIVDITMLGFGPTIYNNALSVFALPAVRVISLLLVAAVMYHAFNGLRIVLIDFWPQAVKFQQPLFWGAMLLTVAGFAGMGYAIIQPLLQGCPNHLCG